MKDFDGKERRKHPRYDARNLRIILKDDRNFRGERIKDISLGGVFVRMEDPFPVGTRLMLTLDPKLEVGEISLEGEVIWISKKGKGFDRGMGVRFREMPSKIEEKLSKLFKKMEKL